MKEKGPGIIFLILFIIIFIGFIIFEIYLWVTYGDTPVGELPSWVIFFMIGGK